MGIMHEYREGDRFLATLVKIHDEGEGEKRYILDMGGVRTDYSKRELDAIACMPVYMTTGKAEEAALMHEKYMQGYREGFEDAKRTVMDALGIAGEQAGYERAKSMVLSLFGGEEDKNAGTDEEG